LRLIPGGWFVLREKYCWLVADKPSDTSKFFPQRCDGGGAHEQLNRSGRHAWMSIDRSIRQVIVIISSDLRAHLEKNLQEKATPLINLRNNHELKAASIVDE
jgi:hypothetical protein